MIKTECAPAHVRTFKMRSESFGIAVCVFVRDAKNGDEKSEISASKSNKSGSWACAVLCITKRFAAKAA